MIQTTFVRKRDGVARRHERRFIISIRVARLSIDHVFHFGEKFGSANSIYHLGINVFKRKFARDVQWQKKKKREKKNEKGGKKEELRERGAEI